MRSVSQSIARDGKELEEEFQPLTATFFRPAIDAMPAVALGSKSAGKQGSDGGSSFCFRVQPLSKCRKRLSAHTLNETDDCGDAKKGWREGLARMRSPRAPHGVPVVQYGWSSFEEVVPKSFGPRLLRVVAACRGKRDKIFVVPIRAVRAIILSAWQKYAYVNML